MNTKNAKTVILAFSGGLDTSFCVPYLLEQGHRVITLFVDTGGVSADERAAIEARSAELGAEEHVTVDAGQAVWDEVVVPMVRGGQLYQNTYPLLVSDRYVIVREAIKLANAKGTRVIGHGCTGMGNDQFRFDQTVRSLGDFEIVAPIREIQREHDNVRAYEQAFLEARGFAVPAKSTAYSINENLLGVTASGTEIDRFERPDDMTFTLCAAPEAWPKERLKVTFTFDKGVCTHVNGEALAGPDMLAQLNRMFGAYGYGRGIYTGDTTIGLKGRIVFEAPGILALMAAHKALEETIVSRPQNRFKPVVAQKWVELVYEGFFYEPLKADLEAYIESSQRFITGEVDLETAGGSVWPVAVRSAHILQKKGAVYAQSADWGAEEAEGFIKLFGQSSVLSAQVNPVYGADD